MMNKLRDLEGMNRSQLMARRCHPVALAQMVKKAQTALERLGKDDYEEYWSLRITGIRRLWAIPEGNVMHVLWWDPDHEICPSLR